MRVYKFRLLTDTQDGFIRDIEIAEDQTFYEFHLAILQTTTLAGNELASFFACDSDWMKESEITLIDMRAPGELPKLDAPMQQFVMKDEPVDDFIQSPRQRFLYEYDFLNVKTFFIELVDAYEGDKNVRYPNCCFRKGLLTDKTGLANLGDEVEPFDENSLLHDFNSLLHQALEEDEPESEDQA